MGSDREAARLALTVCWQCQARMRPEQLICTRCGSTRPTAQMRAIVAKDPLADPLQGDENSWRLDTRTRSQVYIPGGAPREEEHRPPAWPSLEPASYAPLPPAPLSPPPPPTAPALIQMAPPRRAATPSTRLTSHVPPFLQRLTLAFLHETAEVWRATGFALLGALIGGGLWLGVAFSIHYESGFLAIPLGLLVGEGVAIGATVRRHRYTLYALGLVVFFWAICIRLLAAHQLIWSPLDSAYLFFALMGCTAPVGRLPLRSFARRVRARQPSM